MRAIAPAVIGLIIAVLAIVGVAAFAWSFGSSMGSSMGPTTIVIVAAAVIILIFLLMAMGRSGGAEAGYDTAPDVVVIKAVALAILMLSPMCTVFAQEIPLEPIGPIEGSLDTEIRDTFSYSGYQIARGGYIAAILDYSRDDGWERIGFVVNGRVYTISLFRVCAWFSCRNIVAVEEWRIETMSTTNVEAVFVRELGRAEIPQDRVTVAIYFRQDGVVFFDYYVNGRWISIASLSPNQESLTIVTTTGVEVSSGAPGHGSSSGSSNPSQGHAPPMSFTLQGHAPNTNQGVLAAAIIAMIGVLAMVPLLASGRGGEKRRKPVVIRA